MWQDLVSDSTRGRLVLEIDPLVDLSLQPWNCYPAKKEPRKQLQKKCYLIRVIVTHFSDMSFISYQPLSTPCCNISSKPGTKSRRKTDHLTSERMLL